MKKTIGDKVVLALSQEDLEKGIADMEALRDVILMKLKDADDRKELREDFDIAITAMQMLWLKFEGEEVTFDESWWSI